MVKYTNKNLNLTQKKLTKAESNETRIAVANQRAHQLLK